MTKVFILLSLLFIIAQLNNRVFASVSVNKKGDLLLSSLLKGNVIISSGGGDILFEHDASTVSLLRLIQVMDSVAGQICWATPMAPPPVWEQWIPLPVALSGIATTVIGTKIFVIGGLTANNISVDSLYIFDTQNAGAGWATAASMLNVRSFPFAAANGDGSKIYVFGGYDNTIGGPQDILVTEIYDVYNNQWSVSTALTIAHRRGSSVVVNDVIYLFGGVLSSDNVTPYGNVSSFNLDLAVWNAPETPMITPRSESVAFAVGTNVYVANGNDGQFDSNVFEGYDTIGKTWISLGTSGLLPSSGSVAVTFENLGFVFGGSSGILSGYYSYMTSAMTYNNRINTWRVNLSPNLTSGRRNSGAAVVLGNIYLIGGETNGTAIANVESIAPCF